MHTSLTKLSFALCQSGQIFFPWEDYLNQLILLTTTDAWKATCFFCFISLGNCNCSSLWYPLSSQSEMFLFFAFFVAELCKIPVVLFLQPLEVLLNDGTTHWCLASAPNLESSENFQRLHSEHINLHIQLSSPIYHLLTCLLFIISLPACPYFKVLYISWSPCWQVPLAHKQRLLSVTYIYSII